MFERLIAIDWSGAAEDSSRLRALRIAEWTRDGGGRLVKPPAKGIRNWSRADVLTFLTRALGADEPRTAVALDFALSLPSGADAAVFGAKGWPAMVRAVRSLYLKHGTARSTALAINDQHDGHGPYRFDDCRVDHRFYLDHAVPYYRLVELVVPEALSVWYLGSGATVGFHTITGLALLGSLLDRRDAGLLDFVVWPQEGLQDCHVLVEGYPAALPRPESFGPCQTDDERDAWRMLEWMRVRNENGLLDASLKVPIHSLERLSPGAERRVQFEGWILGVA